MATAKRQLMIEQYEAAIKAAEQRASNGRGMQMEGRRLLRSIPTTSESLFDFTEGSGVTAEQAIKLTSEFTKLMKTGAKIEEDAESTILKYHRQMAELR